MIPSLYSRLSSILRVKEQDFASNICTSAQKGETCIEISDNNSPTNAPIIAKCTDTSPAYFASLPIYKAPLVETTEPESNIIRTCPIESNIPSPQPALLCQGHKSDSAAMHIGLAPSATFALFASGFSFIPASAACESESVFNPDPSSLSITTHIITDDQPLQLAARGMHQHSIASESLTFSPISSLQPAHFIYPANSSFLSSFNLYITSPNKFLNFVTKYMPKYFFPIDIIAYPPCNSLQLTPFNLRVKTLTAFATIVLHNLLSAMQPVSTDLAPCYAPPARILHLVRSTSPVKIDICLVLSKQDTMLCYTHILTFQSDFDIFATVISSLDASLRLFHRDIAHAWPTSLIFALGSIFISKASPRPLKPDKSISNTRRPLPCPKRYTSSSNYLFSNRCFMTRDRH